MTLPPKDRKKILLIGATMMLCVASVLALEIWFNTSSGITQTRKTPEKSVTKHRTMTKKTVASKRAKSKITDYTQTKINLNTNDLFISESKTKRSKRHVTVAFGLSSKVTAKQISGTIHGKASFILNGKRSTVSSSDKSLSATTFKISRYVHKNVTFSVPLNAKAIKVSVYVNKKPKKLYLSTKKPAQKKRGANVWIH